MVCRHLSRNIGCKSKFAVVGFLVSAGNHSVDDNAQDHSSPEWQQVMQTLQVFTYYLMLTVCDVARINRL